MAISGASISLYDMRRTPMPRAARKASPGNVGEFSRIGNLGCIRFPKVLRAVAGVKRGDRLLAQVVGAGAIRLEKIQLAPGEDLPPGFAGTLTVEECACEAPPQSCQTRLHQIVTVGWSYVQLSPEFATEIGFQPDAPIQLTGEPSAITVRLYDNEADLEGIGHVTCPP
jgi:bifunctional DNA-binding transcriptional regulator/antitoxin component of YhaV-PrlF toxin-antitoxin module